MRMPSSSSSDAMARNSVSSLRTDTRRSSASERRSGRMSEKRCVFLTLPTMTAWRTPSCLKALISRWSWPSAIQWIRSTTFSSEGSASPVKATAETR